VANEAGTIVATQQVAGEQSFSFMLPPGNYTLRSEESQDGCPDKTAATVSAEQQTKVEVVCSIP
jgi:hypothetical protein